MNLNIDCLKNKNKTNKNCYVFYQRGLYVVLEIAQCLRMLARLNYIMGDHIEAMAYQQKAVLMSERVNGIDHPYTITEYVS